MGHRTGPSVRAKEGECGFGHRDSGVAVRIPRGEVQEATEDAGLELSKQTVAEIMSVNEVAKDKHTVMKIKGK